MPTSPSSFHGKRETIEPKLEVHPTDAAAPFNKSSANLILRSTDHVDFRVREGILVEASVSDRGEREGTESGEG